jgi:hypothetical protein
VAQSLGVSLKRLNGWEPARVTEHEYDDAGRLFRSVERVEVEWDDTERAWMIALAELDGQSCSGCGGYLPETTHIDKSDGYVAEHPWRCHRCEALEIRRDQVRDKPHPGSFTFWPVHEK